MTDENRSSNPSLTPEEVARAMATPDEDDPNPFAKSENRVTLLERRLAWLEERLSQVVDILIEDGIMPEDRP